MKTYLGFQGLFTIHRSTDEEGMRSYIEYKCNGTHVMSKAEVAFLVLSTRNHSFNTGSTHASL